MNAKQKRAVVALMVTIATLATVGFAPVGNANDATISSVPCETIRAEELGSPVILDSVELEASQCLASPTSTASAPAAVRFTSERVIYAEKVEWYDGLVNYLTVNEPEIVTAPVGDSTHTVDLAEEFISSGLSPEQVEWFENYFELIGPY